MALFKRAPTNSCRNRGNRRDSEGKEVKEVELCSAEESKSALCRDSGSGRLTSSRRRGALVLSDPGRGSAEESVAAAIPA